MHMPRRLLMFAILLASFANLSLSNSSAEESAVAPKRPTSLMATVGDVRVRIDGPKLWTISRIERNGAILGVEESAYGTVVHIRGVGNIGTAHLEVEPEQILDLKFFVDDKPLTALTEQMQVQGKSFRVSRESRIRSLHLWSELRVADDLVRQSVRVTSDKEVDFKVTYPLMYAWTPRATNYVFGSDDGKEIAGEFMPKKRDVPRYIIEKSVRWAGVYDPVSRQGTVSYIVAVPKTVDGWLMFADAPGLYRKLYLMCFTEKKMAAGFDGTFKMVTGFYSADQDGWKDAARKKAHELKSHLENAQ